MYLGSVKFYKHLIYVTAALILILAFIGLFFLVSLLIPHSNAEAANMDNVNSANDSSYSLTLDDKSGSTAENNPEKAAVIETDNSADNKSVETGNGSDDTDIEADNNVGSPSDNLTNTDTKVAYLTFDDGPSADTEAILEILKEHDIKATFFVVTGGVNAAYLNKLKLIADEGHAIGIHSHSHIYEEVYASVDSYIEDIETSYNIIHEITDIKPDVLRFPGGSVNAVNTDIYEEITTEVLNKNLTYFDWNVSFEDAKISTSADEIYNSALDGIVKNDGNDLVILAHDRSHNDNTLEALRKVIDVLENYEYSFDKLDSSVEPITFTHK